MALCLLKAVLWATCITGHGSLGTPSMRHFVHFSAPGGTKELRAYMGERNGLCLYMQFSLMAGDLGNAVRN